MIEGSGECVTTDGGTQMFASETAEYPPLELYFCLAKAAGVILDFHLEPHFAKR